MSLEKACVLPAVLSATTTTTTTTNTVTTKSSSLSPVPTSSSVVKPLLHEYYALREMICGGFSGQLANQSLLPSRYTFSTIVLLLIENLHMSLYL